MPCSERPSVRDVARRQITNTFLKTKYPLKNANKNVLDINTFEPGVFPANDYVRVLESQSWKLFLSTGTFLIAYLGRRSLYTIHIFSP
jgi:hypothetical protein